MNCQESHEKGRNDQALWFDISLIPMPSPYGYRSRDIGGYIESLHVVATVSPRQILQTILTPPHPSRSPTRSEFSSLNSSSAIYSGVGSVGKLVVYFTVMDHEVGWGTPQLPPASRTRGDKTISIPADGFGPNISRLRRSWTLYCGAMVG